jgi:uroporphyrinogen decarboxylase
VKSVKDQVPIIHFATNASTLLKLMKKGGGNVIGIDWRINIDEAWRTMGYDVGIQGNLDPAVLLAPVRVLEENVRDILERVNSRPGHIFNLGHGVLPQTPVSKVVAMVKFVKKLSKR